MRAMLPKKITSPVRRAGAISFWAVRTRASKRGYLFRLYGMYVHTCVVAFWLSTRITVCNKQTVILLAMFSAALKSLPLKGNADLHPHLEHPSSRSSG